MAGATDKKEEEVGEVFHGPGKRRMKKATAIVMAENATGRGRPA
eukprot:CAMPEP_0206490742 /NCGR_PEP_ID=MMETSP0324_2-20121206/44382_1 /ASSEMBLY_ACC=CAM_ASM_000836 /TAXON_ID=2866 /ORGANISM="Crypthecodinium cohnii, Strain Seligo" /LENGTH=43 /DNA_ID= /DNA_START= /DNA_END= /DNA_ORIENTATION=